MTATTVEQALNVAAVALREAGIGNARGEARILLGHVLDMAAPEVLMRPERPVDAAAWQRVRGLLDERCRRRPMSQILGRREFWSLDFMVTGDTLDPRPDSETAVQAALDAFPDPSAPLTVLDLGTGTGCLLLAVLSERPNATGVGVDISPRAVAVARRNAERLGLADRAHFAVGDWGGAIVGRFDLMLANPPYIKTGDIAGLEPEVAAFEPLVALDGGDDGLDAYRSLAGQLPLLLGPGGAAIVEIGQGQGESVCGLFRDLGLEISAIRRDLAQTDRCLVLSGALLSAC